jgi:hypothetical protein
MRFPSRSTREAHTEECRARRISFRHQQNSAILRSVVACRKVIVATIGTIATSTIPAPTRAFYPLIPVIPFCEKVRQIGETVETGTEDPEDPICL